MKDFYGIPEDHTPGFVGIGGQYMAFEKLPEEARENVLAFLRHMRLWHSQDALAFEVAVTFVHAHLPEERTELNS